MFGNVGEFGGDEDYITIGDQNSLDIIIYRSPKGKPYKMES